MRMLGGGSVSFLLVDDEPQRLAGKIAAEILREQRIMPLPELLCKPGGMRRNEQVVEIPERRLGWKRLLLEDIESRACDAVIPECLGQRGLIYERSAAYIDQVRIPAHRSQA